jgi:hypothetical protein
VPATVFMLAPKQQLGFDGAIGLSPGVSCEAPLQHDQRRGSIPSVLDTLPGSLGYEPGTSNLDKYVLSAGFCSMEKPSGVICV